MARKTTISQYQPKQFQRVKEFPGEALSASAGKLFCTACQEEVSTKLHVSIIKGHVKASKHIRGKEKAAQSSLRERDIVQALRDYDKEVHPSGETLPEVQRVFRVEVVRVILRAGRAP